MLGFKLREVFEDRVSVCVCVCVCVCVAEGMEARCRKLRRGVAAVGSE